MLTSWCQEQIPKKIGGKKAASNLRCKLGLINYHAVDCHLLLQLTFIASYLVKTQLPKDCLTSSKWTQKNSKPISSCNAEIKPHFCPNFLQVFRWFIVVIHLSYYVLGIFVKGSSLILVAWDRVTSFRLLRNFHKEIVRLDDRNGKWTQN